MAPSLNLESPAVACWIDRRSGNSDPYVVRINRVRGTSFDTWCKLRFSIRGAKVSRPEDTMNATTDPALLAAHRALILDQFTRGAETCAAAPQIGPPFRP